jgi:hypothetical protein
MNTTEYALDTLRRAAEHGYPWSIYPAEATALVAEVERLRAELDATEKERDQWIDAAMYRRQALHDADSLMTGVRLAMSPDGGVRGWRPSRGVDALIDLALDVREERDRLREGEDGYRQGHSEGCEDERAAVVEWLLRGADELACYAGCIERGEHRREEGA